MDFFNLHTHRCSNQNKVLELVNQYPKEFKEQIPYYSIGIHPWHIVENDVKAELEFIANKLAQKEFLALGECGLDKRIEIAFELQIAVFEQQLLLAETFKKPVIVHCVGSFQEVIALKNKLKISVPMIIHGFSKNEQIAKSFIDNGFFLSFGKYLLRNPALASVFKSIPNNRIFLETDTIDETIFEVYEKAKNIKGFEMNEIIASNFETVFQSHQKF